MASQLNRGHRVRDTDVQYLAFEGGGGKGSLYLGVLNVLERRGLLPLSGPPANRQIKGISGASAGAITALLMALGYDSTRVQALLNQKGLFNRFFDAPECGWYRGVDPQFQPIRLTDLRGTTADAQRAEVLERWRRIDPQELARREVLDAGRKFWPAGGPIILSGLTLLAIAVALKNAVVAKGAASKGILAALASDPDAYIYNLVYDRGAFPGFVVRQFFTRIIADWLNDRRKAAGRTNYGPNFLRERGIIDLEHVAGRLTFEELYAMTGVDLRFTGVNISSQKMLYFSKTLTPQFPVAEAVAISMNLPFIFKPLWSDANISTSVDPSGLDYTGFWIDGGVLNNLPIHAFDDVQPLGRGQPPELRPLHPAVLAFRLTAGYWTPSRAPKSKASDSPLDTFVQHLGNVVGTLTSPAEQGQLRTPAEAKQTIDIYSEDLSTVEFETPPEKLTELLPYVKRAVEDYFAKAAAGAP